MTLIKICGITREEDAELAANLGADFLGFIFVKESPRYVTPERAREIRTASGATGFSLSNGGRQPEGRRSTKTVGVFRNASIDEIQRVAAIAQLDLIQLHGNESEEDVRAIPLPVIRAFNVRDTLPETNTSAAYVMFDTGGGTGRAFDWALLDAYPRTKPFFLAGGITPDNVEGALRARPDAIDLASGVERAPGIKDHDKMKRLFERVNR